MNHTETKQVLDALNINRVMVKDAEGNYTREVTPKLITDAIAICEARLARVVEPVEEQQVFEDWLARVCPSGDVDSVHAQWLASWDYREWCEDLAEATPQEAAAQPIPAVELISKDELIDLIAGNLTCAYHCTRVWSAWNVGTMSQDDFESVSEGDAPAEIADAVIAAINAKVYT